MTTGIKIYFYRKLKEDEKIDEFAEWAFGKDCEGKKFTILMEMWNEKHGSKYMLSPHEEIHNSIEKMIELWRQEKSGDTNHVKL